MGLLERIDRLRGVSTDVEQRFSIDSWLSDYLIPSQFSYNGTTYPLGINQTMTGLRAAEITATLPGYMSALTKCPPAFAAQMVRALVLSQARFIFRNRPWHPKEPRKTFSRSDLRPLEQPWPNATTGELVGRLGTRSRFGALAVYG